MRRLLRLCLRLLARMRIIWPLLLWYGRRIEEVPGGKPLGGPRLTILALNPDRFVGDLQILASTGEFRVLRIPFDVQVELLRLYWPPSLLSSREARNQYFRAEEAQMQAIQQRLRPFLKTFLRRLFDRLGGVDLVLGAAVHYVQDLDFGMVAEQLGVPYIVLHKENLVTGPGHARRLVEYSREMGRFQGSRMVVHNEAVREAYSASGYIDPEQVSPLGCLRMDSLLQRIHQVRERGEPARLHGRAVLFSFHRGAGLWGLTELWPERDGGGLWELWDQVHICFARLAEQHPEREFVIKLKWGGIWVNHVFDVLRGAGYDPDKLDNLQIPHEADVHGLILESDVIAGYASTTLMEGAIAGKAVVFPYFGEALLPEYTDYVQYRDVRHIFDVAESPEAFEALILRHLEAPFVPSPELMAERTALFDKYISSPRGDALEKYAAQLREEASRRRSQRT